MGNRSDYGGNRSLHPRPQLSDMQKANVQCRPDRTLTKAQVANPMQETDERGKMCSHPDRHETSLPSSPANSPGWNNPIAGSQQQTQNLYQLSNPDNRAYIQEPSLTLANSQDQPTSTNATQDPEDTEWECHELCTATGHVTSHNCAQTSHTCI